MTIAAAVSNSGGSNASTTTHAVTAGVAYSVGDYIVVVVAADNNGASGANSITGVSDAQGNSYMLIANRLNDPGAAAAGVSLQIYMAKITTALASTDNVTASYNPATTAKSMILWRVTCSAGHLLHLAEAGGTASTANPSQATASLNSGDLVIGAVGAESSGAVTGDSDTTGGSWSAATTAQSGGTMLATSQRKVTTASGAQTYNITLVAADRSISTVTFREVTLAAKTETLTDDFTGTTIDTSKWVSQSSGASQNDVGILTTTPSAVESLVADAIYGFRDTYIFVEVKAWVATSFAEQYLIVRKAGDGNNYVAFIKVGDTLYYRSIRNAVNEDVTTSYSGLGSPTWFRLREASGQTHFDTSTDGTTWTTRRSIATNHMWGITDSEPILETFTGTAGEQFQFDNLNVAPAAGVALAGKGASSASAKATTVQVLRGLGAKAGASSSARSVTVTVARPLAAKAGSASSAKGSLSVARVLSAKGDVASSAKAATVIVARPLSAKAPASDSARALTVVVARPLSAKAAASSSGTATLTVTGHAIALDGKAAAASSAKGSLAVARALSGTSGSSDAARATLRASWGLAARAPAASGAKGSAALTVRLGAKAPAASSAKGTLGSQGQIILSGKAGSASSARGDLRLLWALTGKAASSSSAKATPQLARVLGAKAPAAASAKGSPSVARVLGARVDTAASARAAASVARRLAAKAATAAGATGTLTSAGQIALAGRASSSSSARADLAVARQLLARASSAASATGTARVNRSLSASAASADSARSAASLAVGLAAAMVAADNARGALSLAVGLAGTASATANAWAPTILLEVPVDLWEATLDVIPDLAEAVVLRDEASVFIDVDVALATIAAY